MDWRMLDEDRKSDLRGEGEDGDEESRRGEEARQVTLPPSLEDRSADVMLWQGSLTCSFRWFWW
jgi:hypothetical protein